MKTSPSQRHDVRGFALVITLTLVALLVLAGYALTALARINSRIAGSVSEQTAARQNAMVAFDVAFGALQRQAGPDARVTGMAGVSGVPAQSTFRQWAGIWNGASSPAWLVSGATDSATPSLSSDRLMIVGPNSVGNPTDTTDQEPVEVGLIDLPGIDAHGLAAKTGRIAYWVGDEGVKVSAVISDDEMQTGGKSSVGIRPNFRILISSSYDPAAAVDARVLSLEQLKIAVPGFSLGPSFHSLTRAHDALATTASNGTSHPGSYVVGAFNINTTSEAAWRALLEFPDSDHSILGLSAPRSLSAARQIRDRIAGRGHPFDSVGDLIDSNIIQESFDAASPKITGVTQTLFFDELLPVLVTRSDTFRIRAYGDVLDSVDHSTVRASAWCEAIVQRTPEMAPDGSGRRFVVTYFRWLGSGDI